MYGVIDEKNKNAQYVFFPGNHGNRSGNKSIKLK